MSEAEKSVLAKLHKAVTINDIVQVGHLIKKFGAHDRQTWLYGRGSPIHSAAGFEKVDILKALLAAGFDPNAYLKKQHSSSEGVTPLMWAAVHNRAMSVRVLLAHGADAALVGAWQGTTGTARAFARKARNDVIVQLLREHEEAKIESEKRGSFPPAPFSSSSSVSSSKTYASTVSAKTSTSASSSAASTTRLSTGVQPSLLSAADESLISDLKDVINRKICEREKSLMKAEVTKSMISNHEAEIERLRQTPDFRTDEGINDLKKEIEQLRENLNRVHLLVLR